MMYRIFTVALTCAACTIPLGAAAQGGSMVGGSGSPMSGMPVMGSGTSMMRGAGGMPIRSGAPASAGVSQGEVRKVDGAAGKLTLRQDAQENGDMPAMTMVFRVRDPAWLQQLKVGDKVRFVSERIDGYLTIVALEPEKK